MAEVIGETRQSCDEISRLNQPVVRPILHENDNPPEEGLPSNSNSEFYRTIPLNRASNKPNMAKGPENPSPPQVRGLTQMFTKLLRRPVQKISKRKTITRICMLLQSLKGILF